MVKALKSHLIRFGTSLQCNLFKCRRPLLLRSFESQPVARNAEQTRIEAVDECDGTDHHITHSGNGPISAFVSGVRELLPQVSGLLILGKIHAHHHHKQKRQLMWNCKHLMKMARSVFGAGIDTSITLAPIKAVISAINRLLICHKSLKKPRLAIAYRGFLFCELCDISL